MPADCDERSRPQGSPLPSYEELVSPAKSALTGRDRARRRLLLLADALGLLAAFACAALIAAHGGIDEALIVVGCLPLWALTIRLLGLYDRDVHLIHSGTLDEVPRIALALFITGASSFILAPPMTGVGLSRGHTLLLMGFGVILVVTFRSIARAVIRHRFAPQRCLIVGSGVVARLLARKIAAHPEYGVTVVGLVDAVHAEPSGGGPLYGIEADGDGGALRLGDHTRFTEVCREFGVERIVIAFSSLGHEELLEVVATSKALNVKITVVPRLFEAIGHSVEVDQIEGMTLLGLRGVSRTRSKLALKRAFDLTLGGLMLLVLSPVLAVVALAVKLTTPGAVLFTQQRIGRDDRPFEMLKFRTMVRDAEQIKPQIAHLNEAEGPMFKIADDPRLTRVGRLLRRMSLDELPQLWNVMRGDMSLVGPRPLVPGEDHHVIGRHRDRLRIAPGLTGPWQVLGRTAIPFQEMVKLDYLYVAEWSLWNDVKLILRTVPVVLRARGS
ncbi:MAG: sugar transferase [Thermoleophilaceae bacterium]